jgi:hypothetical protein
LILKGSTMSNKSFNRSELNPPENITPSKGTVFSALAVLIPISTLFVALFTGLINP